MWPSVKKNISTMKPMSRMLLCLGIFFAIVFGFYGIKKLFFIWAMSHYQPPAITVSTTKATSKTWQSYLSSVGSLSAVNGVDLATDVPGIVSDIHFNSGQFVTQGAVLASLDTSLEKAALKDRLARLKLVQINYQRNKKLFERNVSSQAALDTNYAELQEAEANVELVQAQIKQKTIIAPFSGRIGIRQVNIGQYISPGASIVTLQSLNPLYVMFNLPENYLPDLYLKQSVEININFGKGKTVNGTITAINSKVDQITRNVLLQATIPNEKYVLYPGMFASIKIWLKERKNTIVVPQTAISYSLSGDYVFVVKNESKSEKEPQLKVYRRYVTVGERRGDVIAILDGLKENEVIVTSGQLKLQNGTPVVIDNKVEL